MRALAAAVIAATIAVTGAGTVHAEPRSIHESIGVDTLGSADTSTLSKPTRKNMKDCSEAVAGANLEFAILTGCFIPVANLAYADLRDANLAGEDLTRAILGYANLAYANLAYANLAGAILTGAILAGVNLTGVNLTGANLTGVTGWDTVKGKDTIIGLDQAIDVPG